jgi:uncharacterized membrane protein YccC
VDYVAALRTAILVMIVLLVAYRVDLLAEGLSLGFGVLFTALGDRVDSALRRFRGMAWMALWGSVGVLIGGLISEAPLVHVIVAFIAAGLCGYAGALGPRGALVGTISLVLIAVYAGTAIGTGIAVLDATLFLVGGAASIAVNLALTPLHRLGMARRAIARAYREFAATTSRTGVELAAPIVGTEIMAARVVLDHEGVRGETSAWLHGLLGSLERARFALLAVLAVADEDSDYVAGLIAASGGVARGISRGLVGGSWGWPRPDVRPVLAHLESQSTAAPTEALRLLAQDLAQPLRDAVDLMQQPWPVGRRADMRPLPIVSDPILPRLRSHWRAADPIREHALRLSIAFGTATLLAVATDLRYAYWLPMTVAWITKPDLGGTVTRVTMRIAGTLAGIILTTIVLLGITTWPQVEVGVAMAAVAVSSFFIMAYIWANYPIAVIGITAFVILLDLLGGGSSSDALASRVAFTLMAGAWVLAVSLVRPRRTGAAALESITAMVTAIRDYAATVRAGEDTTQARSVVLHARTTAITVVAAAATEPRGLWERPGPRVDPEDAAVLLTEGLDAATSILAEEVLGDRVGADPHLWERIDAALDDMDARVSSLAASPD